MGRGYSRKPLRGLYGLDCFYPRRCRGLLAVLPYGLCPFPLAKFYTSAVGRCPFPLAIYGEGVADRPGVRSNVRVLSPTGEIAHERSRIERSEIGVARARIER